ncbi:MAG: site-specific DNA-methyltransferase [Cyanobacteriota bacterium]|nr:site-specific DNA-methyltransferase [Cyanobacteriota bacterium]
MFSLASTSDSQTDPKSPSLVEIETLDRHLQQHFQAQITVQPSLTRSLVSFQANKTRPVYRWYKYKEAFSASLVEYLLSTYSIARGKLLDPFAGSGTALFAASSAGLDADGIELLPIAQQIVNTKKLLDAEFTTCDVERLKVWLQQHPWQHFEERQALLELKITQGAYPDATKVAIERYLAACEQEAPRVRAVLRFALLCILESISYTRKDGQYLRWDYRSGRGQGKKSFNKGEILDFQRAICDKINEILEDLALITQQMEPCHSPTQHTPLGVLYPGSCLEVMPNLSEAGYDAIITSPPYCNRYDYTRTYALELALLGVDTEALRQLRQTMLSCTVENRPKALLTLNPNWQAAVNAADEQPLLQAILNYLDDQKAKKQLNNTGIPRMVRGYFYEMACVIQECFRLLKPGAFLFMVNDNVRYAGASISVDLILSNLAEKLGFEVEQLLVLPSHKGNSSQQMRDRGRSPLRKCVYVWKKPSLEEEWKNSEWKNLE